MNRKIKNLLAIEIQMWLHEKKNQHNIIKIHQHKAKWGNVLK